MYWLVAGCIFAVGGLIAAATLRRIKIYTNPAANAGAFWGAVVMTLIGLFMLGQTSVVWVPANKLGHMEKVYGWANLPVGQIISTKGEKGPQATVLPPGFHVGLGLNVIYNITFEDVFEVPSGQCAKLRARDGKQLPPGETFAEEFRASDFKRMIEDAEFFLGEGAGFKGVQTSVLPPGSYYINRYLWGKPELIPATQIEKGNVGVVRSAVHSRVAFSGLEAPEKPLKTEALTGDELRKAGVMPDAKGGVEVPSVHIVPVGARGIWVKPLHEGTYYLNPDVYQVTNTDTRLQTWDFQGGYTDREIVLQFDQAGKITQTEVKKEIEVPKDAEDKAVSCKMEGWEVYQELRVVLRIEPHKAPFVVAAVGGMNQVRDQILIPSIRSTVRTVNGGAPIKVHEEIKGPDGKELKGPDGKVQIAEAIRPTKVLDTMNHRELLEDEVLKRISVDGSRYAVTFSEVAFGHSEIPPELLVARRREQIADQIQAALVREKAAQEKRIETEKASAEADRQKELVAAEIEVKRAEQLKKARQSEGEGEKAKLMAIAEGQKAQFAVLGERGVITLRIVDQVLKLIEEKPEVLNTLTKIQLPDRITIVGDGSSLTGAAAVLGEALSNKHSKPQPQGTTESRK